MFVGEFRQVHYFTYILYVNKQYLIKKTTEIIQNKITISTVLLKKYVGNRLKCRTGVNQSYKRF